jgi:hypothetical protein
MLADMTCIPRKGVGRLRLGGLPARPPARGARRLTTARRSRLLRWSTGPEEQADRALPWTLSWRRRRRNPTGSDGTTNGRRRIPGAGFPHCPSEAGRRSSRRRRARRSSAAGGRKPAAETAASRRGPVACAAVGPENGDSWQHRSSARRPGWSEARQPIADWLLRAPWPTRPGDPVLGRRDLGKPATGAAQLEIVVVDGLGVL